LESSCCKTSCSRLWEGIAENKEKKSRKKEEQKRKKKEKRRQDKKRKRKRVGPKLLYRFCI
jgi:hypothetical protein